MALRDAGRPRRPDADKVEEALDELALCGPQLGRPLVDRIHGSKIHNLKELRPRVPGTAEVRLLFVFDAEREAIVLALAEEFHAEATQLAVLPYRVGLADEEALREAVAGFWRTYAKRRGELIGIFQAAMIEGRFRDRWLELRGEAIARIATAIRAAQSDGYCPGVDPLLTASALSAMLEHFCYIWLGQGGEKDIPFDDQRALDAVCTIWVKAVYWRCEDQ